MKTLLAAALFFVLQFTLHAQDTTLPQGNSQIHLKTGKMISRARLWKIDTLKIEYVKSGNLADVPTAEVKFIESPEYLLEFGESNKMTKRHFDLIIPYAGDSIRCFIRNSENDRIFYTQTGITHEKMILKEYVKEYVQWPQHGKTGKALSDDKSVTKSNVVDPEIKTTNSIDSDVSNQEGAHVSVKKPEEPRANEASYYHESYMRGEADASHLNSSGWGLSTFFLGMIYGAPYVSAAAASSEGVHVVVPPGVDAKLYKEGYRNTALQKKVRSATRGAAVAKGVVTVIFFLIVL